MPGSCCYHRGSSLAPGARLPLPSKCSWLVCRAEAGGAWLELEVDQEGCHCCLAGESMVREGTGRQGEGGRPVVCYRGKWLEQGEVATDMEVAGQRVSWNSSLGVLTMEATTEEEGGANRVFLLPEHNLRVVRDGQTCLVTRLEREVLPETLLAGFKEWKEKGRPGQVHHSVQVTRPITTDLATSAVVEAACANAVMEEATDLPVTEELFLSLKEHRLLTLASPANNTDCRVGFLPSDSFLSLFTVSHRPTFPLIS